MNALLALLSGGLSGYSQGKQRRLENDRAERTEQRANRSETRADKQVALTEQQVMEGIRQFDETQAARKQENLMGLLMSAPGVLKNLKGTPGQFSTPIWEQITSKLGINGIVPSAEANGTPSTSAPANTTVAQSVANPTVGLPAGTSGLSTLPTQGNPAAAFPFGVDVGEQVAQGGLKVEQDRLAAQKQESARKTIDMYQRMAANQSQGRNPAEAKAIQQAWFERIRGVAKEGGLSEAEIFEPFAKVGEDVKADLAPGATDIADLFGAFAGGDVGRIMQLNETMNPDTAITTRKTPKLGPGYAVNPEDAEMNARAGYIKSQTGEANARTKRIEQEPELIKAQIQADLYKSGLAYKGKLSDNATQVQIRAMENQFQAGEKSKDRKHTAEMKRLDRSIESGKFTQTTLDNWNKQYEGMTTEASEIRGILDGGAITNPKTGEETKLSEAQRKMYTVRLGSLSARANNLLTRINSMQNKLPVGSGSRFEVIEENP